MTSFDTTSLGNTIIDMEGENCLWKQMSDTVDDEYGQVINQEIAQTTVKAIFMELRKGQVLRYPGETTKYDSIAYVKYSPSYSVGDKIIRNPGKSNERSFEVGEINEYPAYKELDLEES